MEELNKYFYSLDSELKKELKSLSQEIFEYSKFGTQIFEWTIESCHEEYHLPLTLSIRNYVELLASTAALFENSLIIQSKIFMRTMLESCFYVKYIFNEENQNNERKIKEKCMLYLIWHIHNEISLGKKFDINNTNNDHKKDIEDIKKDVFVNISIINNLTDNSKEILHWEQILENPLYKPYEQIYLNSNKKEKKNWFSLASGPENIAKLAKRTNLYGLYESVYKECSSQVHGANLMKNGVVTDTNGNSKISKLFSPSGAPFFSYIILSISILFFNLYIENLLSHKKGDFQNWLSRIKPNYDFISNGQTDFNIDWC